MAATLTSYPVFTAYHPITGAPLNGGKLYTFETGTSTPKTTWTDSTKGTPNANPVVLDSAGTANVWIDGSYRFRLDDSNDVVVWGPIDDINDIQDLATDPIFLIGHNADGTHKDYRLLSEFADLAAAVTAIGATDTDLWLDADDSSNATIPITMSIKPIIGNVMSGTVSDWPKPLGDPKFQWLSGDNHTFVDSIIYSEWWGIDGTADEVQINQAIQSLTRGKVQLEAGQYTLADPIVMKQNVILAGVGGSRNYGNELATSYVTELYQGDASKDGIQIAGFAVLFSGFEIKDLDVKGNAGTARGIEMIGGDAGSGFAIEGFSLSNVTVENFDGSGGKGIYIEGNVFRGGFFNVTCHDNENNFLCTDDTYSGTPSSLSFYNCSFRGSTPIVDQDRNFRNDSGGSGWGFYNCDFSRAQNAGNTGTGFYTNGLGTAVSCNFESSDIGAQIAANGFKIVGSSSNDCGVAGIKVSADYVSLDKFSSGTNTADDILIDAGSSFTSISVNASLGSLTITDNGDRTIYPDMLEITSDGTLGSTDLWIPRVKSTIYNAETQDATSTSNEVAIDMSAGSSVYHVLTENTTFKNPTNDETGDILYIVIVQPGGGSYTYTLDTEFEHNVSVPVTVTASKRDTLMFINRSGAWRQLGYENDIQ